MITEKLVIENFAGLNYIDIEIKKINILIGPQASGKSIIAKILFYCKGLISKILTQGMNRKGKREFDQELKTTFAEYFPMDSWGEKSFSICYYIGEEYIKIKSSKTSNNFFNIEYSDFYKNSFNRVREKSKQIQKKFEEEEEHNQTFFSQLEIEMMFEYRKHFLDEVSQKFSPEVSFSQLFIPAGRLFFAHLHKNIFSFLSQNNTIDLDPFLVEFGVYYDRVKKIGRMNKSREHKDFKSLDIDSLKNKILVGQYLQIKGKDYLKMSDGRQIQLSNCSSGQQEALPLTLILESIIFFNRGLTGQSIYIEEPEAHLFPTAQKNIVDLIATVYNSTKERSQFFIMTHSPYILTSFNNLLQAGILAKNAAKDKLKRIIKIVPKSRFLNTDEMAVYSLSDGNCKSIICEETGLIDAEIIDAISQDLAIEFDNLLEIE